MDAILAGACGYLLKDASIQELMRGLEAAAVGESLISSHIAGKVLQHVRATTAGAGGGRDHPRRALRPRDPGAEADRERQGQRDDRRRAPHQPEDGQEPHLEHPDEAPDREPDPGRGLRRPSPGSSRWRGAREGLLRGTSASRARTSASSRSASASCPVSADISPGFAASAERSRARRRRSSLTRSLLERERVRVAARQRVLERRPRRQLGVRGQVEQRPDLGQDRGATIVQGHFDYPCCSRSGDMGRRAYLRREPRPMHCGGGRPAPRARLAGARRRPRPLAAPARPGARTSRTSIPRARRRWRSTFAPAPSSTRATSRSRSSPPRTRSCRSPTRRCRCSARATASTPRSSAAARSWATSGTATSGCAGSATRRSSRTIWRLSPPRSPPGGSAASTEP